MAPPSSSSSSAPPGVGRVKSWLWVALAVLLGAATAAQQMMGGITFGGPPSEGAAAWANDGDAETEAVERGERSVSTPSSAPGRLARRRGKGTPACAGAALSLYAKTDYAPGGRVSLGCSSKRLFAHACFAPRAVALAPGHVAVLYSSEDYLGDRLEVPRSASAVTHVVRSVLVCGGGVDAKECVPGSAAALPLCEEEVEGDALARAAALSKTDAARFGYLGKGVKARKFRPLESHGLLLKSMGAELRQEACFYKEVIQDIARGCGPDDAALRALVTEGHVVKFSGVALMERRCDEKGKENAGDDEGSSSSSSSSSSSPDASASPPGRRKRLEFLALEDMLHGLTNSSLIDIDVSGQPNAMCRLCSVDVKNFKTWNYARGQRVVGDRVWWKRETRCVSKQVSSGLNTLLIAGEGAGSAVTRSAVLEKLLPKMERAKQLLLEQKEVDFVDGSFLIAYGVDAAGELVVRLRVIDFGHAVWRSQAKPRLSEVVGGKKWFENEGKLTPGKFGCGASELLARLKALHAGRPLPSACMERCLSQCKAGQKYQCKVYNHADEKPISDERTLLLKRHCLNPAPFAVLRPEPPASVCREDGPATTPRRQPRALHTPDHRMALQLPARRPDSHVTLKDGRGQSPTGGVGATVPGRGPPQPSEA